ncbi:TolB protein [Thiopseudomonas denitrificans]|uniref:Tol-Pal system protein TolB n=2 Tax=Thiopseudomonas denitrificans TaxID=1501432 RepID=A0A4R6U3P6_9GAMM|nr:Tol-Pal system beta propeller repeat protein TolB [Thiopseudomonas denitrificans]TDQ39045.1 TolB protein [Thiopseudomonas denitrificans]
MKIMIRLLIACLAMAAGTVFAADPLVITRGTDRAIPIAVVPFGLSGAASLPEDPARIIGNDLHNSGFFNPLAREHMISMPARPDEIIYRDWRAVGAQYLLIGEMASQADGRVQIRYHLLNVTSEQQVHAGTVTGTVQQLRDLAHHIADQAHEKITGIKGAFSTRLLFVTASGPVSDRRYTLYRADYDGARAVTLLQSREPILSPTYAPDGQRIAYVSFEQKRPRIYVQQVETGQREQVTNFEGLNGAPAWSPDSSKLAFVLSKDGNPEIYVMEMASRQVRRVTNHMAIDTEPFWGKDGHTLYFTSDRSGRPQIYRASINGGEAQRVTFSGNYNANPKLSADEKTLVMIHRQDGYKVFKVAAQDLQRGTLRILSDTSLDESPTVAPNGSMVIYATRQQGKGVLMLTSLNGRVRTVLPGIEGEIREPSWSPFLN